MTKTSRITHLRDCWPAEQLKATTLYKATLCVFVCACVYVCLCNESVLCYPILAVLRLERPGLFPDSSLQLCLTK